MLISTVAGVGGGSIAVPMAVAFFGLAFKKAIAISSCVIMMTTISRFIFNFKERHPEKPNCTSIDYNLATVMMPLNLIGSLVGAYAYNSFPELYLMIILTLLLAGVSLQCSEKFFAIWRSENAAIAKQEQEDKRRKHAESVIKVD